MSSIHGVYNSPQLLFQQLAAAKSSSTTTTEASASSTGASSDPTDTVHLSLNQIRDAFQDARISYNERNGNLTSDQAAALQSQIATVQQTAAADEQSNSGPLTSEQKVALNQMQNQISSQIYDMANDITSGSPTSTSGLGS